MMSAHSTVDIAAEALKARRGESLTDWQQVDAMDSAQLERLIAEDADERGLQPDWTRAALVLPKPKQSVHLRLEQEVVEFFRSQGKGHIARMQAVLKTYADAHRQSVK
jgi:uncharacterized protein (DUF4415 family)